MGIKIACQCGQRFEAKERLAGKTLECPKCGSALKIPHPKRPAEPKPPTQPKPPPEATLPDPIAAPMANLLDEAGLDEPSPPNVCPGCGVLMPQGAIVCMQCGYHQQLGRKIETEQKAAPTATTPVSSADGPIKAARKKGSWGLVATGLNLVFWAIVLFCVLFCLMVVVGFQSLFSPQLRPTAGAFPWAMIVAYLLGIAGRILCLNTPQQSPPKQLLIIVAVVLELAALAAPFVSMLGFRAAVRAGLPPGLAPLLAPLLGPFLLVLATIVFLFFLRHLAADLERFDLVDRTIPVILGGFALVATPVAMIILSRVDLPAKQLAIFHFLMPSFVLFSVLIFGVYVMVNYIGLLFNFRQEILGRNR